MIFVGRWLRGDVGWVLIIVGLAGFAFACGIVYTQR